jgi:hypothetical protein
MLPCDDANMDIFMLPRRLLKAVGKQLLSAMMVGVIMDLLSLWEPHLYKIVTKKIYVSPKILKMTTGSALPPS